MIYLELFWEFFKIGCFTFGGAYGSIPLIRDAVLFNGWMDEEMLSYMIAVSESTPGPIMVNLATYTGSECGGVLGAAVATLAVVLPAFIVIIVICVLLKTFIKNKYVQAALSGLKACVVGIVLSTGVYMTVSSFACVDKNGVSLDLPLLLGCGVLWGGYYLYRLITKKKLPPIVFIMISAVFGVGLFSFV